MIAIDDFSNTLALIYDASLDVARWDDALASLARMFGGSRGQISYVSSLTDSYPFFRLTGFTTEILENTMPRYRELMPTDPRVPPSFFKAFHCRQLVSDQLLRASEMYRQVLAPAGIEYSMFFLLDLEGDAKCVVSLMRGPDQAPYTAEDCEDFGRFIPHVSRAVSMHGTIHRAYEKAAVAAQLIDGMPLGMIVLDGDMIAVTNAAARTLLDEGHILSRTHGRLRAAAATAQEILANSLAEARAGPERPIALSLSGPGGDVIRLVIRRLPQNNMSLLGLKSAGLVVYIGDSRRAVESPEEVLQRLFGLTQRQASVLRALVQSDDDLDTIAERLGVGRQTVKTHVRHILQATGAKRRAELIRLVLTSPAWIATQTVAPRTPIL